MTPVLARTTHPFKPLINPDDARGMGPDELDLLTVAQIIAFRMSGDVAASLVYARRLEHRIRQVRVESRKRFDGPLWYFHYQIGTTLLAAGETSRALVEFATTRQLGVLAHDQEAERMALGRSALAHAIRGSLDEAERALREAEQLAVPSLAHIESTRATERTAAAVIGVERMAPDLGDLVSLLEPADSSQTSWPFALLARCRAYFAEERPEDAIEAIYLASAAHPVQHGSFATDVMAAMSIEAHIAISNLPQARRIADESAQSGLLTSFAKVRLLMHECRYEEAGRGLRAIAAEHDLGPSQRAEMVLMTCWLELAQSGAVDPAAVTQVARVAHKRDYRRLFTIVPRQLIELVAEQLPRDRAETFSIETGGIASFQMQTRPILTISERRVLNAIPVYGTTALIADAFHVSPNTVKTQLKSLYRKLDCATREEAIKVAARLHLLDPDGASAQALR